MCKNIQVRHLKTVSERKSVQLFWTLAMSDGWAGE
jgi:hypothetical protein